MFLADYYFYYALSDLGLGLSGISRFGDFFEFNFYVIVFVESANWSIWKSNSNLLFLIHISGGGQFTRYSVFYPVKNYVCHQFSLFPLSKKTSLQKFKFICHVTLINYTIFSLFWVLCVPAKIYSKQLFSLKKIILKAKA